MNCSFGSSRSRRAAIQVSLHWIFVMIIGAIILTFFITIVAKQKQSSETNQLIELRNSVRAYISGAENVDRFAAKLPSSGNIVAYGCDKINGVCGCEFRFGKDGRVSLSTGRSAVFSSSNPSIGEDDFMVSTLTWSMPYPVTNFVYFAHPRERFLFAYDKTDPLISESVENIIKHEIPKIITPEIIDISSSININDLGHERIKIILFGDLPGKRLPEVPIFARNTNTRILHIPSPFSESDRISFYSFNDYTKKFELEKESFYVGLPSLIGAVFVDSYEDYDCAMQNSFLSLKPVNEVHLERIRLLRDSGVCSAYYSGAHQAPFEGINRITENAMEWDKISFTELLSAINDMKVANKNIMNSACPLLY